MFFNDDKPISIFFHPIHHTLEPPMEISWKIFGRKLQYKNSGEMLSVDWLILTTSTLKKSRQRKILNNIYIWQSSLIYL